MAVLKRKIEKDTGWPPARRVAQSARMRANHIWLRSTGPRTAAGKRRASANSLKTGIFTAHNRAILRQINLVLRAQRAYTLYCRNVLRCGSAPTPEARAMLRHHGLCITGLLRKACLRIDDFEGDGFSGRTH